MISFRVKILAIDYWFPSHFKTVSQISLKLKKPFDLMVGTEPTFLWPLRIGCGPQQPSVVTDMNKLIIFLFIFFFCVWCVNWKPSHLTDTYIAFVFFLFSFFLSSKVIYQLNMDGVCSPLRHSKLEDGIGPVLCLSTAAWSID